MKDWTTQDIFKTWTEGYQRLWESLSKAAPVLRPPEPVERWRELYLSHLAVWEAAVKQALAAEAEWVRQWTGQVTAAQSAPIVAEWARRMEEMLEHWIVTQTRLWDEYFALLRQSGTGFAGAPAADQASPQAPPAAPEPLPLPPEPALPEPLPPPAPAAPVKDDLKTISGIGPATERKLNAQGIVSYRQLAQLSEADIEQIERSVIKFPGRIRRDKWLEQAKEQHFRKYHETL